MKSTRKAENSVDNLNFLVVAGHVVPGVKTTINYRKLAFEHYPPICAYCGFGIPCR